MRIWTGISIRLERDDNFKEFPWENGREKEEKKKAQVLPAGKLGAE